jgi:nucleotide sugar dehydrogenase
MNTAPNVSVIGLGRVGLPLALSFADRGLRVLGVDKDSERLDAVRAGRMPFHETGTQEVLDRVHAAGTLELSDRVGDAAKADDIVITLGTPSFSHIEIDIRQIRSALDALMPVLRPGHSLVLRSTIAPGTTEFVGGYLHKRKAASSRRSRRCRASSEASARAPRRAPASCSRSSAPRSCRRPRCRPSWPRSGPTSCATRTSRFQIC